MKSDARPRFGLTSRCPDRRRPRPAAAVGDFLWCKLSDFFLTPLPQLLSSHRRQMMLFVVRDLTVPHHEDDLQPLGAQRPQSRMMIVAPRPLLIVVCRGPLAPVQGEERHMIDVTQRLVTGEAEPNDTLLAVPDRHGHATNMPLEVLPRLPPPRCGLSGVRPIGQVF